MGKIIFITLYLESSAIAVLKYSCAELVLYVTKSPSGLKN